MRAAAKLSGEQSAFRRAGVMTFEDEATSEAATR
jgi:hypothetical protein